MHVVPITGTCSSVLDSLANLFLCWGLAVGSYLFVGAAITKIAAGLLNRRATITERPERTEEQINYREPRKSETVRMHMYFP